MFPSFGIENGNEIQCSQLLGLGMKKTVLPTQVGKELTKESWENENSCSCLDNPDASVLHSVVHVVQSVTSCM